MSRFRGWWATVLGMAPASSSLVVSDAKRYVGAPYKFGGGSPGGWDCSGFVNYVLGHDLGLTLPGGITGFTGSTHGPVVIQYAGWGAATTITGPPAPGDLVIWPGVAALGHIGIATDATHMISALNPHYGTSITPIAGYGPPVPLIYRRITGVVQVSGGSGASLAAAGCPVAALMLPALPVLALVARRNTNRKAS